MSSSHELFERAKQSIPGGVNSPVRAFSNVNAEPRFIKRGDGPFVTDVDGVRYVDYVGSWGALILGHNSNVVRTALTNALTGGTSFGAPTEREVEFAELICQSVPGIEMVRLVNSGTEATMTAIRLARGHTGRDVIIKCNGCYHGHSDSLLVKAGSGVATFGIAGSPGIPEAIARNTVSIEFNDLQLAEDTVKEIGADKVAAIIIEPIPGNMGMVQPEPNYLSGLCLLCDRHGIVFILDEVMSGFRVALGGASERYGVSGDLVTLGKVIGGGLPIGAVGGRREIMTKLAPSGSIYQAGTLSGNPLAVSAGLAVVKHLRETDAYVTLEQLSKRLVNGLQSAAKEKGIGLQVTSAGGMFGFFFSDTPVKDFSAALRSNRERFIAFFHEMLAQGIYLAPSAFEAGFVSTVHSDDLIDQTIAAAKVAFEKLS